MDRLPALIEATALVPSEAEFERMARTPNALRTLSPLAAPGARCWRRCPATAALPLCSTSRPHGTTSIFTPDPPRRLQSARIRPGTPHAALLPSCPSWNEAGWRGSLYAPSTRPAEFLGDYCRVFNAVEGNTTFYAWPSADTVRRWSERMPAGFRFCAKLPRDISHEGDLRERLGATREF